MKDNDTEVDEEKNAKPEKASGNKNGRILFFGILGGVVLLNTVVAFVLIQATRPKNMDEDRAKMRSDSLKQVSETATLMGATTAKAPVEAIVNIAGTDGERFLKAAVIFEFDDKQFPELAEELLRRAPKLKNILINHLSKLTLVEVTEPDAKNRISKDILRLINSTLPPKIGQIREVMFTSFIIQ